MIDLRLLEVEAALAETGAGGRPSSLTTTRTTGGGLRLAPYLLGRRRVALMA